MSEQLAALQTRHPAPPHERVLLHRGTCGDAVGSGAFGSEIEARLDGSLGVVEAACDGACWAAPAATVVRDTHIHRFARLDEGDALAELAACAEGRCDAEGYAGEGCQC